MPDQALVVVQSRQHLRRGERDVQEKAQGLLGPGAPQLLAQGYEVIVVDPDQIPGFEQRRQQPREFCVHALIRRIVRAVEGGKIDPVVEQRPQGAIGVAVVIVRVFVGAQVHGGEGDMVLLRHIHLAGAFVADRSAPPEPQAASLLQGVQQSDRQAARAIVSATASFSTAPSEPGSETRLETMTRRRLTRSPPICGSGGWRS